MVSRRLPIGLVRLIRPLLFLMALRTRCKTANDYLVSNAGVRQAVLTRSQLFEVSMDSFLTISKEKLKSEPVSMFLDDLTALVKTGQDLKRLLEMEHNWSVENNMTWNISKYTGLNIAKKHSVQGQPLQDTVQATYPGVTLTQKGVGGDKLVGRILAAISFIFFFHRTLTKWRTTVENAAQL